MSATGPGRACDRGRQEQAAALSLLRRVWATHGAGYDGPDETSAERAARVERMAAHVATGLDPRGREVRWPEGRPLAEAVVELDPDARPDLVDVARLEDALEVHRTAEREKRRAEQARAASRSR